MAPCQFPSLIPMSQFTDELLARVSLASVIGQRLTWDARKSRPSIGDYWACCPFHQEKTPSFHVDDQKGLYYCFGCHESGNALTFVRNTDNLDYREAVEFLANFVGMQIPASEWRNAAAEASHKSLYDICEQASRFFQLALKSGAGSAARDYLAKRGVDEAAVRLFEIGLAANRRNGLTQHLTGKGIAQEKLQEAGLSALPDDGGAPYDRFRDRIIFPIRDSRGRLIGFGGRSLSPSARAKYLNSPETPIFKKGACLYNHRPAREALKDGSALVVAEGYMDVIALSQAGIRSSVAPLGTAITESQLYQLWKLAPEPVLALDGDSAGLNAAQRASRLALPILEPGKSLGFCFLPDGTDPDDFVRQQGTEAMRGLVSQAMPLAEFIWRTEFGRHSQNTPESRAAFESSVRGAAATIRNQTVRRQYEQFIRERLFEMRRLPARKSGRVSRPETAAKPSPELKASLLVSAKYRDGIGTYVRERAILGICLTAPQILDQYPERLESLEFADSAHRRILDCIIESIGRQVTDPEEFQAAVRKKCGSETVDRLLESSRLLPLRLAESGDPASGRSKVAERAGLMLSEELNKMESIDAARREFEDAVLDAREGVGTDPITRIGEAAKARGQAQRGFQTAKAQGFITAENGVLIDPEVKKAFDQLVNEMHDKG